MATFIRQKTLLLIVLPLLSAAPAAAQATTYRPQGKAIVVDERLAALRRDADTQAEVLRRLRTGRVVYLLGAKVGRDGQRFCRVAVTRRTRGWLHEAALAVPGRAGEDARVLKLLETVEDEMDRIGLCQVFVEVFHRSPLVPRALMALGEEAERAAAALTRRARGRLNGLEKQAPAVPLRVYYLNDVGLDRYSRAGLRFEFNEAAGEFVYDGQAYREVVRRFPNGEEAARARQQLDRLAALAGRQ